jgi:rhodanese-related sulfurtransferase
MRLTGFVALCALSFGVAAYAVIVYGFKPLGALVHPDMRAVFEANRVAIYAHIFASAVALALGPFQFSARLRNRRISLHRWLGRFYLGVGVVIGGLSPTRLWNLTIEWNACENLWVALQDHLIPASTPTFPAGVAKGHLPGARSSPRGFLEVRADLEHYKRDPWFTDRSRPMVLYCGGGHRSALAAKTLQEMGFTKVVSLAEGWTGWTKRGYPTER